MRHISLKIKSLLAVVAVIILVSSTQSFAHCDGLDGPVVKAARQALDTKNVNLVLIWVSKNDENTITEAFQKTLAVRNISKEVQEMADMYFFETLVRLHRAGEGEPYTGLKPAGRDLGLVIPAADLSIEKNSFEPINNVFTKANLSTQEIKKLFNVVLENKNYNVNNVESGRKYVKAYVTFLHFAEENYESAQKHQEEKNEKGVTKMEILVPKSLKVEHEALHSTLAKATKEEGEIGAAAKQIAKILHGHFVKEEEFALPPLGLLADLANGHITEDMKSVLHMTDKLKADLPQMLEEHKQIVQALDKFADVAKRLNRIEYVEFAENLKLHAQTEEEVMYPTAILVGEYIKLKLH